MSPGGTIYQRQSDGLWVACVTIGGRRITKYGETRREAQQRLAEMLTQEHAGTLAPPTKLTLQQWADQWLGMLEGERRPATLRDYRLAMAPVLVRLGTLRLDRITPFHLAYLFTELRQAGRGSRSVEQSYVVLGTELAPVW